MLRDGYVRAAGDIFPSFARPAEILRGDHPVFATLSWVPPEDHAATKKVRTLRIEQVSPGTRLERDGLLCCLLAGKRPLLEPALQQNDPTRLRETLKGAPFGFF